MAAPQATFCKKWETDWYHCAPNYLNDHVRDRLPNSNLVQYYPYKKPPTNTNLIHPLYCISSAHKAIRTPLIGQTRAQRPSWISPKALSHRTRYLSPSNRSLFHPQRTQSVDWNVESF